MKIDVKKLQELDNIVVDSTNEHFKEVLKDDKDVMLVLRVPSNSDNRQAYLASFNGSVFDNKSLVNSMLKSAIVSWTGFVDGDGNEIPCNDEMKELLLERLEGFAKAVDNAVSSKAAESQDNKKKELSDTPQTKLNDGLKK